MVPTISSQFPASSTLIYRKGMAEKWFVILGTRVQFPPTAPPRLGGPTFCPCSTGRRPNSIDFPHFAAARVGHIDRSHSLRWASPRSQCVYLCRSRPPEPTLRPDRWFLSVCHPKVEFRGARCDVSGKIVEVRHKMMFREQ